MFIQQKIYFNMTIDSDTGIKFHFKNESRPILVLLW